MQRPTPPTFDSRSFVCPFCEIQAHQEWAEAGAFRELQGQEGWVHIPKAKFTFCQACGEFSVWVEQSLIYPMTSTAPLPQSDLPEDVKADFMEARMVFERSPRSAAALLRLCVQKLMPHLGEKGKNIDTDIGNLVAKGMSPRVQQALDVVRVVGNHAVHPGQIDFNDNKETAWALFELVNYVVEQMITNPNHLDKLYGSLPQSNLDAIKKRDGK